MFSVRMYIHQSPHSLACEEDAPLGTRAQDRTMLSPSVLLPHASGWIGQWHSVGMIFVSSPPERESTHVDLKKVPVLQYECPTENPSTTPTKQVQERVPLLLRYLYSVLSEEALDSSSLCSLMTNLSSALAEISCRVLVTFVPHKGSGPKLCNLIGKGLEVLKPLGETPSWTPHLHSIAFQSMPLVRVCHLLIPNLGQACLPSWLQRSSLCRPAAPQGRLGFQLFVALRLNSGKKKRTCLK